MRLRSMSSITTALSLLLIACHCYCGGSLLVGGVHANGAVGISQATTPSSRRGGEEKGPNRSVEIDALVPRSSSASRAAHYFHYPQLNTSKIQQTPELSSRERWLRQSPALARILDEGNNNDDNNANAADDANANAADDAYANAADDGNSNTNDDATAANDDYQSKVNYVCKDTTCTVNEQCTKFLFGFLEGTTDANDNCDGIMNAYVAADCGTIKKTEYSSAKSDAALYADDDDFNDDYFGTFYDHQCCSSLRSHYFEYCDMTGLLNEFNLLVIAAVMLLCECAKSVVKKNNIHWLPESAACMLVGIGMAGLTLLAGYSMEQFAFDEEIFMFILLPPIIFEAALTVNKREFRRRRGAIIVFAVFGTIMSSFVTGMATYYAAKYLGHNSLTMLDSLVFGSLISSIDPVAILSVLTSLNMSETDTIYIIVLGESLLNDGIAITLFKSLIQSYQTNAAVTTDGLLGSIADFVIIASGSFAIGLACGFASLFFFLLNKSILHPVMEVASFFVWAVVPYWLAEAFSWSGIVAIVVMGFFMDMYLRPGWDPAELQQEEEQQERINRLMKLALAEQEKTNDIDSPCENMYYKWGDGENKFRFRGSAVDIPKPGFEASYKPVNNGGNAVDTTKPSPNHPHPLINEAAPFDGQMPNSFEATSDSDGMDETIGGVSSANVKAIILKREFVRLSREADEHVRFVAHILSSLSENAIFAYLGLFLFSSKYKWNALLCTIGTISCIFSRAVMVIAATRLIWYIHVFRQRAGCDSKANTSLCIEPDETNESEDGEKLDPFQTPVSKSARALSNYKVQVVLILAGLRGAVSLALVESVPIYNGVTGVGCKHKGLLKAMTSSAIIFSIFVLGGGAWYILKRLDISDEEMLIQSNEKDRGETFLSTGFDCGVRTTQEMELATAPSWRVETAPSWRNHDHRLSISVSGSYSGSTSNFLNTPSPSQVPRSRSERSDWPRVSDNTGLML